MSVTLFCVWGWKVQVTPPPPPKSLSLQGDLLPGQLPRWSWPEVDHIKTTNRGIVFTWLRPNLKKTAACFSIGGISRGHFAQNLRLSVSTIRSKNPKKKIKKKNPILLEMVIPPPSPLPYFLAIYIFERNFGKKKERILWFLLNSGNLVFTHLNERLFPRENPWWYFKKGTFFFFGQSPHVRGFSCYRQRKRDALRRFMWRSSPAPR